jgi:hypothetical protein
LVSSIGNAQKFNSLPTIFKFLNEFFLADGKAKLKYESLGSASFLNTVRVSSCVDLSQGIVQRTEKRFSMLRALSIRCGMRLTSALRHVVL